MAAKTTRTPAAPTASEPLFIDFPAREGGVPRHMQVRVPSPEQLAVWQGIGETFTRLSGEWQSQSAAVADLPADHPEVVAMHGAQNRQAIRGLGRSMKLIKSVLVDPVDHDWVEDAIMEGATLEYMLGIVTNAVDALRARAVKTGGKPAANTSKSKAALAE